MGQASPASWDDKQSEYRQRWEERYAGQGGRWDDYAAAYQYAWTLAHTPGLRYGRSWSDVEPEFQRGWLERGNAPAWEAVRALMRDVWNDVTDGGRDSVEGDQPAAQRERASRA